MEVSIFSKVWFVNTQKYAVILDFLLNQKARKEQ